MQREANSFKRLRPMRRIEALDKAGLGEKKIDIVNN